MNTELLLTRTTTPSLSESALSIIDSYRDEFQDRTSLDGLEMEFPYLQIADKDSIQLLETGDNLARTFKWRGALVAALALQQAGHERLVVPSAGNHARGAILAAKVLGMSIDVVVPRNAPRAKREGLYDLNPSPDNRLHVFGENFDESLAYAYEFAHTRGGAILHPYDNEFVGSGQGTILDDTLRFNSNMDHLVVTNGGGGQLGGILKRLKELGREDIPVTAVQAPGSNSLSRSLEAGRVVAAEAPNQAYGGSAVRYIGPFALQNAMDYPNLNVITANQSDIDYVTESYLHSRYALNRTEEHFVPAYEPTSLVAIAGLFQVVGQGYENTVVVGTGHNAPIV